MKTDELPNKFSSIPESLMKSIRIPNDISGGGNICGVKRTCANGKTISCSTESGYCEAGTF